MVGTGVTHGLAPESDGRGVAATLRAEEGRGYGGIGVTSTFFFHL